jgi:hypothetical protein
MRTLRIIFGLMVAIYANGFCYSQHLNEDYPTKFAMFGGAGLANPSTAAHGGLHLGVSFDCLGVLFEGGYAGPINDLGNGSALLSANYSGAFTVGKSHRLMPFFTGGYTRLFGTGNAINFGGGIDFVLRSAVPRPDPRGIRFEVRDYFRLTDHPTYSHPEHNAAFRIAYVIYGDD